MRTPWVEQLNPIRGHTITGALDLVARAATVDGSSAISEQALLKLRHDADSADAYAVIGTDNEFQGFALVSHATAELVVDPAFRRQGIGTALLERVLQEHPEDLALWAHGEHPGAEILSAHHGLAASRRLWQMRMPLGELPELTMPEGTTLRTFHVGADEAMWLGLNARAFAEHAEQGRWTEEDLRAREQEPWFDARGFLLAERAGIVVGFHWTKVHEPGVLGEVYVLGVDPSQQGSGLGKALTLAGLRFLHEQGIGEALLYVDETNVPAIRVYERLGFIHVHTDVCFRR